MQTETNYFDLDTFDPNKFFKEYHNFKNFSSSAKDYKKIYLLKILERDNFSTVM